MHFSNLVKSVEAIARVGDVERTVGTLRCTAKEEEQPHKDGVFSAKSPEHFDPRAG